MSVPPTRADLHALALRLVAEMSGRFAVRVPTLEWRRYRTTAGMAHYDRWAISLSVHVLVDEERLRDTLVHEFAHLLAYSRHGEAGRGHGHPWRAAMIELGASPETKHRYPCRRNRPRQVVVYRCTACSVLIRRARRLPRRRKFVHVGCGGEITFHSIEVA
jgi:predicted SprT family Zn-dependent metalloprotease